MRGLALVVLAALAATAVADDDQGKPSYRAVVDRVELEPASITGLRLRVYLSALAIDGQMLDLTDPKAIRTYVGGSELKAPYALGPFASTSTDSAIVVIVQATQDFSDALPSIADALSHDLIEHLGEHSEVAILPYGENTGTAKLQPAKSLAAKFPPIPSDGSVGDPALMDSVDHALLILRKADAVPEGETPHPMRKMIIIIGDGRDRGGDHDRVTAAGKRAAKDGVRIHAIAYSPADVRRPLLVLGELTKQSLGTFRWPGRGRKPTTDSWSEAFKQLEDEIDKQYVLTYFVNHDDEVAGKRLHVVTSGRTETTSNEVKVPEAPSCAGTACENGYCSSGKCVVPKEAGANKLLMWTIYIGGGAVGAFVLLGTIGMILARKNRPAPLPGEPGGPILPPGMLPNGTWAPTLLVMTGPLAGKRLYIRNGFLIGKQPGCDLQIEDQYASSQHCQIGMDAAGNCKLYDRGSTNGTLLNGVPVTEAVLQHGVTIRIGGVEIRFLTQ